jgi:hypothetical protein
MILALAALAVGCSNNATESEISQPLNLDDAFGGYTPADEAPGFDDPELLASVESEEDFNDPIALTPEIAALTEDPNAGVFHFRAVWGQLCLDTEHTALTDFSGSLEVTRGGILVRRIIRFEVGQDWVEPRTDRKLVEWVSQTSIHNDGIAVDVIIPDLIPDPGSTEPVEPVEVTFTAGSYSRTFTLREIAALDTIVDLDDGNQIAFAGHLYSRCPRGMLAGHWGVDEEGNGAFRGRWIADGRTVGFLRGHYGVNDNGRRVFFGKWITENGRFEGFIRGTWGEFQFGTANRYDRQIVDGHFEGRIYTADEVEIGALAGRWLGSTILDYGFFHGRWRLNCPRVYEPENDMPDGMRI